jgi:peroxiredoxin
MSRIHVAAAAAALALFLAGCSKTRSASEANIKSDSERKPAPAFSLKDADGKTVNLADYRGKVVLLNFWATWCGPCEVEIPWFIEFQQKYKDRDFAVLGVSLDDDGWKSVRPYIASHKINYPIMIGTEVTSQQYGEIDSLPTTFILDRQGRIATQHVGLVDKRDYQNEILKLLDDSTHAALRGTAAGRLAVLFGPSFVRPDQRP